MALPLPRSRSPDDPFASIVDWTPAKFSAALARAGFEATAGGIVFVDRATGRRFVGAYEHGRIVHRKTLAKLIRERDTGR